MPAFTIGTAKLATNEELAASILENTDGRPISVSFLQTSAVELAKRILPGVEPAPIIPRDYYTKDFEADKNSRACRAVEQNWQQIRKEKK